MAKAKKIVIIGAGPGGLTAGMILANRGFEVEIFEREAVVGGRNGRIEKDGYIHDIGPTFLMMKFILDEMFTEAGEQAYRQLAFSKLEPMYRLWFSDRSVDMSSDPAAMRAIIAKNYPGDERGFDRFLAVEQHRMQKIFACLQKDYCSPLDYLNPVFLQALPSIPLGESLYQYLGRYFKHHQLKLAFTFQAKYLGMSPWQCPAFFIILSYIEHAFGIYHVQGGLSQISQAMARVFEAKGGKLHLSTPVKRIMFKDRKAAGVILADGQKIEGDEVVINADFSYAAANLFPEGLLKKYSPDKLRTKKHSCSTLMYYWGVDQQFAETQLEHHNIFFADNYHRNVKHIIKGRSLGRDFSFYVRNASLNDPTLAPAGKSELYILVPAPNNKSGQDWKHQVNPIREKILEQLSNKAGLSDLAMNIRSEVVITPRDWQDKMNIGFGATFNLAHTMDQMLYLRPHNRFEEVDNTWLVGGGTHPGSGLPTIYESGRITANLLCEKYHIPFTKPSSFAIKKL